ncbi:hypothetical protein HYALB_00002564 [Hymenoscyphus albidus]|uniref:Peptidase A1 domain-containing protein n=1 Tax=Hymenoscyphus albidus TaxID=595503 RepID=A0A9N9QAV9_9HELO|nr:hypothetical protein HYALB_00002564 [Hymenoscyphus albidus]
MELQTRANKTPAPFSFAPSQIFEGNDGKWSTFALRVGTPEQIFHVLISTAGQETWVPVPEGCLSTDPSDCGAQRGVLPFRNQPSSGFQINASSTWTPINRYELGLDKELNYTGNGEYGFDTSGGVSSEHQLVAGIATKDFYLGMFGLGPKPTNFTTFNNPQGSFLWSERNQSLIPSLSWGYTAGANYQLTRTPGSLTLGGYDASRFIPNNLTFQFGADDSKPLTLGLQAIQATNTFQGVMSLLPSGILTFIDSTVPEIWLPLAVCRIFEAAFGLQYDPSTDRYLVNDIIHAALVLMNPVLTFKIGSPVDGGNNTNINLPYKAFDLQASYPIYPNTTNYFPLRRAMNDSQYTLGRNFLQEAYVIADYERSNFSVSQCVFNEKTTNEIITIKSPAEVIGKTGLQKNALIGIVVAAVVFLAISLIGVVFWFRRRKSRRLKNGESSDQVWLDKHNTAEDERDTPGHTGPIEASADHRRFEIMGREKDLPTHELLTVDQATEMIGRDRDLAHELYTVDKVVELPAGRNGA